ncbi:hypothetical protein ALC56_07523, partial [Trachymyrmex septentrionalis]
NEQLKRQNIVLVCKRFKDNHTYDKINELMLKICNNFQIDRSKILKIVTNNAQNMLTAFTDFRHSNSLHSVCTSISKLSLQLRQL